MNSPATQQRLYKKFMASSKDNIQICDTDDTDSDVEIIESKQTIVVLEDDDDDDGGNEREADVEKAGNESSSTSHMKDTEDIISTAANEIVSSENTPENTNEIVSTVNLNDTSVTVMNSTLESAETTLTEEHDPPSVPASVLEPFLPHKTTTTAIPTNAVASNDDEPQNSGAAESRVTLTRTPEPQQTQQSNSSTSITTPIQMFPSYAAVLKHTPTSMSSPPLFFDDKHGSIDHDIISQVPLYDSISDDSFIWDQTLTPQRNTPKSRFNYDKTVEPYPPGTSPQEPIDLVGSPPTTSTVCKASRKRKLADSTDLDDSVIFVSETISNDMPKQTANSFITLNNQRYNRPTNRGGPSKLKPLQGKLVGKTQAQIINKDRRNAEQKRQNANKHQQSLPRGPLVPTTTTVANVNNTYNPTKLDKTTKRMVIIDGSNVAYS